MSSFEWENRQTKYNVLGYRIDLYLHGYKLAKEIEENGHSGRNIAYEMKRQKALEQELACKLILIKKTLIFLEQSMKYLDTSNNQLTKF